MNFIHGNEVPRFIYRVRKAFTLWNWENPLKLGCRGSLWKVIDQTHDKASLVSRLKSRTMFIDNFCQTVNWDKWHLLKFWLRY